MTIDPRRVAEAVEAVRARIRALAGDRQVQLVAVTKGFGPDAIDAAVAAGCTAIGENYAQELVAKIEARTRRADDVEVHFIGQLQSNKVRSVAGIVSVWETLDRESVAVEVARRATSAQCFVQVNTTAESGKGGCLPEATEPLVARCRELGLRVEGLMTVGPTSGERDATARAFAMLRAQADDLGLTGCSMGMTHDFELALEHGATHLRIGSALFGERPQREGSIR